MRGRLIALIGCASVLHLLAGCSDPVETTPAATGSVVVGITSELRSGVDFDRLHVTTKIDGKVTKDETLTAGDSVEFPLEIPLLDIAEGAPVEVDLEASARGTTLVRRAAATEILAGKKLLLRAGLDSECVVPPAGDGPACEGAETCVAGTCRDPKVDPKLLQQYSPDWAKSDSDVCKSGDGDPIILVGEGQSDYYALDDLATAQIEAGPQGGHHIWVAIRMKNLLQSGSITEVKGRIADLDKSIEPLNVIFTFDKDEGGYCKLAGLRFQLDQTTALEDLFGRVLDVTVTVTDKEGDVGVGEKTVTLSTDTL